MQSVWHEKKFQKMEPWHRLREYHFRCLMHIHSPQILIRMMNGTNISGHQLYARCAQHSHIMKWSFILTSVLQGSYL